MKIKKEEAPKKSIFRYVIFLYMILFPFFIAFELLLFVPRILELLINNNIIPPGTTDVMCESDCNDGSVFRRDDRYVPVWISYAILSFVYYIMIIKSFCGSLKGWRFRILNFQFIIFFSHSLFSFFAYISATPLLVFLFASITNNESYPYLLNFILILTTSFRLFFLFYFLIKLKERK